jgi:hypothetical protein
MAMPVVRPAIKNLFVLSWLAALAAAYFCNTPIPYFLSRMTEVAVAGLILIAAGTLGTEGLKALAVVLTPLEEFVFGAALGFGFLSLAMILLGLAHGWTPLGGWLLLGAALLRSGPFLRKLKQSLASSPPPERWPRGLTLPGLAVVIAATLTGILAFAPITYYDSLVYHLALPAAYLRAQHWVGLQQLIYSAFPQTLEMLWTLGLLLRDDTVTNLIAWTLAALSLVAVYTFGRRFFQPRVGLLAAALWALMPAFLLLNTGGYVDVGLALFGFLALYAACLWITSGNNRLLTLAGLMSGWAMGTKYTGAIPAVLIGLLIVSHGLLHSQSPKVLSKAFLCYAFAAVAIFCPWLIKNMIYVGNPLFPFLSQWGIQSLTPWLHQGAQGYFRALAEYTPRSIGQIVGLVWQASVNGLGFGRGIDVLGDYGWIPLFALLPALGLCRRLKKQSQFLLAYTGLYFLIWAVSRPVLRFLLPLAPPLALLAAVAWVEGIQIQPAWVRWPARGLLACFLASGLFLFFFATSIFSPFTVALGIEDRDAYLRHAIRNDYYGAAQFINTHTPKQTAVYVVGDQRGYYYQREVQVSPVFAPNPLVPWANEAASAEALRRHLKAQGFSYLLVNRSEMARLGPYHMLNFNTRGEANWKNLLVQLAPAIYHDHDCEVFAL